MIDVDLGMSASSGARVREGFKQLLASVALSEVGIVLSREPSRLSRRPYAFSCRTRQAHQTTVVTANG